ncbi:hypothetical protein LQW54_010658 [Pestalotiopsis sp. IQ-011]
MYLVQKAFSFLDPGGYLEIQTAVPAVVRDNNACDLLELFSKRSREDGEPITAVALWESFLRDARFEDITVNLIRCGEEFTHNFSDFLLELLTKDSLRGIATIVAEALKDSEMKTALRLKIVQARKPSSIRVERDFEDDVATLKEIQ